MNILPKSFQIAGEQQFQTFPVNTFYRINQLVINTHYKSNCSTGYAWNHIGCSHTHSFKS